jgi:hypothetical protein
MNGLVSLCSIEIVVSEYVIPELGPMFVPMTIAAIALLMLVARRVRTKT